MINRYADNPTRGNRARQIWCILIGHAHRRQTITYGELADLLGYRGAGTTGGMLGCIAFWCQQHDLPALYTIVVNA